MIPQTSLPAHLERFAEQLVAAGHKQLNTAPSRRQRWRRPTLIATPVAAAVAVAVVWIVSATSVTSPAYALTAQPGGSYTLTLYRLTSDIPQLNAKLAQMGIDETVVPVTSRCTYQAPILNAGSSTTTTTLYAGREDLDPGDQGVLAAEALPNGQIALVQGAMAPADIPSCFATLSHTHITVTPGPSTTTTSANTGTGTTGQ